MYNNLLKSGNVVKNEEARVIDSNSKIAERIAYLEEILENAPDDFYGGFSEGLNAMQVEQLLTDQPVLGDYSEDEYEMYPEEYDEASMQVTADIPQIDTEALERMQEEARLEAESVLSAAREEADRIVAEANALAQGIRDEAKASGHGEGYQAGYDEGLQIAKEAEEKLKQREEELEAYYMRKIDELEPLFIDKLTDIYEHVFMLDLSDKKELVKYLLVNAMRNIEGGRTFLVHVAKEDYEYVSEHKDELTAGLPGTSTLEIIEDMTLSESECFIEADSGIFDCGLGTELSLLKKELTLLSYRQ